MAENNRIPEQGSENADYMDLNRGNYPEEQPGEYEDFSDYAEFETEDFPDMNVEDCEEEYPEDYADPEQTDWEESRMLMERKRKKRRRNLWIKAILIVVLFFAALILGTVLVVNTMLNKISRPDLNAEYYTESELEEIDLAEAVQNNSLGLEEAKIVYPELDPAMVKWSQEEAKPITGDLVNLLLIGQDRREGESRQRSDAMILVSINKTNKSIKLISFLRDLYVQIPGFQDNRLNAAYAFGGMSLLDETLEYNFGVHVDANIEVDFDAFTEIIDRLGGVDVEIDWNEADYLGLYDAGLTHMDGKLALAYSRIRYIDSDFGRTNRQRNVLNAVYNDCRNLSVSKAMSLCNEFFPMLTTDMTNAQIVSLGMEILEIAPQSNISGMSIPVEGSYSNNTIREMMVLVPDLDENRAALQEAIGAG